MAYVYILKSKNNDFYYIGATSNIGNRLQKHNKGKVISTKGYLPFDLIFKQEYENILIAKKVEKRIKKLKRKDYLKKIINDGIIRLKV